MALLRTITKWLSICALALAALAVVAVIWLLERAQLNTADDIRFPTNW